MRLLTHLLKMKKINFRFFSVFLLYHEKISMKFSEISTCFSDKYRKTSTAWRKYHRFFFNVVDPVDGYFFSIVTFFYTFLFRSNPSIHRFIRYPLGFSFNINQRSISLQLFVQCQTIRLVNVQYVYYTFPIDFIIAFLSIVVQRHVMFIVFFRLRSMQQLQRSFVFLYSFITFSTSHRLVHIAFYRWANFSVRV